MEARVAGLAPAMANSPHRNRSTIVAASAGLLSDQSGECRLGERGSVAFECRILLRDFGT